MYYDDEARRFNFLGGLIFGAALGASVALLTSPRERLRKPDRMRRAAGALTRRAGAGADSLRDDVREKASSAWTAARSGLLDRL